MIYIPQGGSNFYLSENFMTWEFRCRCCRVVKVDEDLINGLEELRELAGCPLYVLSGYRCPAHNKAVGGARRSFHMKGMAADIWSETIGPGQLVVYAEKVAVFGGIGLYHNFIHVDIRDGCARWGKQ